MATDRMAVAEPAYRPSLARRVLNIQEIGVLVAVVVFFGVFVLASKSMAESANLVRMATQGSMIGLCAFGMSFLMITGEIDLSSGATAGLAAAVAGLLRYNQGWPEWACYGAALAAAMMVGLLNSFVVLKIRMPSFFATLGSSFVANGLAIWLLKGAWLYVGDRIPSLTKALVPSPFFDLPWVFVGLVALFIIGDVLMRTSRLGPTLTAVGGNRLAAEIVGINVPLVKTLCFVFVSLCCGLAGLLVMGYAGTTDPAIGDGWLLWVVAIAIIGGGSLRGGVGSIIGALLGTVLIQIIRMGLANARVQTNAQGIVVGAILIGAAALDVIRRKTVQY
ncbi:MAG: ABC transporter permease [Chloroflexi bacterium]|nr:ABC transporter permease [Chloroflexota bacterium]